MNKILALTSGLNVPSSRFRVRQFIPELERWGLTVNEVIPLIDKYSDLPGMLRNRNIKMKIPPVYLAWALLRLMARIPGVVKSITADVVWLEREFQPGLPTFECLVGKPLVFDVDDAIWLERPFGDSSAKLLARRADKIMAGNQFLADWFSQWNPSVELIPTAIDTRRFKQKTEFIEKSEFVIGWSGSSSGFEFLYEVEKVLVRLIAKYPEISISIVADKQPIFRILHPRMVRFVHWDPKVEADILHSFDVGIMPLSDTEWSRGKCGFKLLQYMASGIPTVASAIGANNEILSKNCHAGHLVKNHNEWYDALECIYLASIGCRRHMGWCGRKIVTSDFSTEKTVEKIAGVLGNPI